MFSGSKFNGLKTRIVDVAGRRRRGRVVLRKRKLRRTQLFVTQKALVS